MESFQTIITLMFVATLLVGLSQKIKVPYPICLVLGGAIMGFIPLEYVIYFDPDLILLIVLPPILYYAAFEISFREFRSNLKEIVSLALGLVAFNTFVVGLIFHLIFPFFPFSLFPLSTLFPLFLSFSYLFLSFFGTFSGLGHNH